MRYIYDRLLYNGIIQDNSNHFLETFRTGTEHKNKTKSHRNTRQESPFMKSSKINIDAETTRQ